VRDQQLTVQGAGKYEDAVIRLWQARAESSVALWNRENPEDPTTIESWAARYPVEIVSERSTDFQSGARALSQFAGARARTADLARLSPAGMVMSREGGQKWVVMHRPSGNVKSAIGNVGEFSGADARILFQARIAGETKEMLEVANTKVHRLLKDNGTPLLLYHGGCDWEEAKIADGLWLTANRRIAEGYADQHDVPVVKQFYVSMLSPLDVMGDLFKSDPLDPSGEKFYDAVMAALPGFEYSRTGWARDRGAVRFAIKYAKENGYDGLIHPDSDVSNMGVDTAYVVFDSSQLIEPASVPFEKPVVERGQIRFGKNLRFQIALFEQAGASTFIHESAHAYLEILRDMAARTRAADSQLRRDWQTVKEWLGIAALGDDEPIPEQAHEQFARGWEAYMREGIAPNAELQGVFERFSEWLCEIYRSIRDLFVELTPEVVEVMDRMLRFDVILEAELQDGRLIR